MSAIIAIVGRPNVGKSTLFNRISKSRDALVDDQPGVTRDRLYALIKWEDTSFTIIDTGGFDDHGQEPFMDQVREQVAKAIEEADRIIFIVDGRQGVMPGDQDMAHLLRMTEKPVFMAVNKIDGPENEHLANEFYSLGVDRVYPLSGAHGYGLRPLMEDITRDLPKDDSAAEESGRVRVAILGRPNAGKSSLINRILGDERLLVSDQPGTTRDSIDTLFNWKGREYLLIDTAGIRRKSKVKDKIEKISMIKTLRSLDRCHIAVILIDAETGIADQDARICGYAIDRGRGVILAVNKWDLIKGSGEKVKALNNEIERQLNFVSFAPRINVSALTGERVKKLFEKIDLVNGQFNQRIGTGVVNRTVEELIQKKSPPKVGQGRLKLFYATQASIRPPTFVIFVNNPSLLHVSYKRYLVNQMREHFDLVNSPVRVFFREKKKD